MSATSAKDATTKRNFATLALFALVAFFGPGAGRQTLEPSSLLERHQVFSRELLPLAELVEDLVRLGARGLRDGGLAGLLQAQRVEHALQVAHAAHHADVVAVDLVGLHLALHELGLLAVGLLADAVGLAE